MMINRYDDTNKQASLPVIEIVVKQTESLLPHIVSLIQNHVGSVLLLDFFVGNSLC